jgi:phytoene desaturase (3,4-didehydrolycopene-forming)
VKYHLNTPISQILLSDDGKRARGVILENGETLTTDVVIVNADLIYAYSNLLPQTAYAKSLTKREASCSSISFYWALNKQIPELSAHNIFLAEDYKESFDSIFKKHQIPDEPSFYVNVPSRVDPSAAPAGCDSVVVLVPVGHLLDSASETHKGTPSSPAVKQDWNTMVSIARKTILKTIESRLHISLSEHIVHETLNTPLSWKDTFNLDRGAILGLSHSFFNVLCFRPKTKHSSIEGLHFVGASTHPGTGVPIVLAGARIVAAEVLKEYRKRIPWEEVDGKATEVKDIDKVQGNGGLGVYYLVVIAFAIFIWMFDFRGEIGGWDWSKLGGGFVGDW